ncbi:hypothetical protein B7R78_0013200 [Ralstonia solanacearum]|uniref:Proline-rich protein n=1 Tax=Ralstonia solanacearum K60 TaxID=1091042 RepID=A0AAP7ZKA3_RALSL|nr:hypothetical protein [Ralstonia solanacearum]MBT1538045.1 hypothetical protein [Ralstonia solanacearum]OYQ11998.1 hypothetical protein B7R77_01085 [Ralstonia solanacearum K60]QOK82357.1 hypothetical protein HF906_09450 [Ralstonia solanacearum]RIJ88381.1 hypothetical protein RSP822_00825 [Ralstonia solanacearum]CCF96122.1 conserved hypothetical protein [Ralstonia solanacearum K60]
MTTTIYQKTDKGLDEIRTRAHRLDQKHRALLLMVNGEKTCDQILTQLEPLGMNQAEFDDLERGGYIRPHVADVPPPAAASAPQSASFDTSPPANNVARAPVDGHEAEGYQRLYRFYTETISRYLGLRGYLLEMKVEKAASLAELIALRETLKAALSKTRGEPETGNVIAQLDLLIDEATN